MILTLRKHQEIVPGTWDKWLEGIISPNAEPCCKQASRSQFQLHMRWIVPTQVLAKRASQGLSSHAHPSLTPFSWTSTVGTSEAAPMPEPEGETRENASILALLNWKHWGQIINGGNREAFRFSFKFRNTPKQKFILFKEFWNTFQLCHEWN